MLRRFLRSKIHRATVTGTDLHYEGSLTLDPELMKRADILPDEAVDVYNITRGTRFTTYAIEGTNPGSGELLVNGAAAHLVEMGDLVIVCTYCDLGEEEWQTHESTVILVDENNSVEERLE
ncbi:aspartate 1-decarboxylase [bacterium]|nr:aspartate 1-decarboxylase [bacterium]